MRRLILLAFFTAAIAAITVAPAAAGPPGTNGKIVTNSDNRVTGEEQVYSVDPDGSDRQLVMNNAESGQWSPDGVKIAINGGIFNFDAGTFQDLSLATLYPNLFLGCGVWSPDGTTLACEGGFIDPTIQGVYTVRASDGGDLRQITSDPFGDDCPSDYSPNGQRLVGTVGPPDGPPALFVVNVNGSGRSQITPTGMNFNFCNGSWSPQGNEIVFSAHVPDFSYHSSIWVVHSDGSGLHEIPVPGCGGPNSDPAAIGCFNPSWSPDGTKILFGRRQGNSQADLYTVHADGSGLFQVTNTPDIDEFGGDWGTHPVTP
jgi:Tol biopolymer transport system component